MSIPLAWVRPASPVLMLTLFAAAILDPAGEAPLRLGTRVRELQDLGHPWTCKYVGRTEDGLYVLRSGEVYVLAQRREFITVE